MNCPACNSALETIQYKNQEVDLCRKCGGMWFDEGELLKVVNGLLFEDEIDPQTVKKLYRKKLINADKAKELQRKCPRCNVDMSLRNYSYNSNIIIDKCPSCQGIWTDKGEMQAVARYVKRNPDMGGDTKALVWSYTEYQNPRSKVGRILAVIVSLIYMGIAFHLMGSRGFLIMLCLLPWPLFCIFLGEDMVAAPGTRFGRIWGLRITKPMSGTVLNFVGWILLLVSIFSLKYYQFRIEMFE